MSELFRSFYLAWRSLLRRPGFTFAVVFTLALGIGGTTALYTLSRALFLDPIPAADLSHHNALYRTDLQPGGGYTGMQSFSYADFLDLRERTQAFSDLVIYQWQKMNFSHREQADRLVGEFISEDYFAALGLDAELGRFPTADEASLGGNYQVVVLGHGLWRRLFASDPEVVGKTVQVNGHPFEVIGVAPPRFSGIEVTVSTELWVPISAFPNITPLADYFPLRETGYFRIVGRRAPGVSHEEAAAEMGVLSDQLAQEYPDTAGKRGITLTSLRAAAINPRERDKYVLYARFLFAAAFTILLVGAINVGNLLLVRGMDLQRELALRQAIGSPRRAIIHRLLGEMLLLFGLGGALSLPLGAASLALLWKIRPPELESFGGHLGIDYSVVLVALGLTVLSMLACAALPMLRSSKPDIMAPLRAAHTPSVLHFGRRPWGRSLLVVSQLAIALISLIAAGQVVKNLAENRNIPLGFDPDKMVVLSLAPGDQAYDDSRTLETYDAVLTAARAVPGVESAALSENRLLRGAIFSNPVYREGETEPVEAHERLRHRTNIVTSGFFEVADIPLLDGRDFGTEDCLDCPSVAVINRAMAEGIWPGEDALGKRFTLSAPHEQEGGEAPTLYTVVGVVENCKYRYIDEALQFFLYLPLTQHPTPSMILHARTLSAPNGMVEPLSQAVRATLPDLPLSEAGTMQHYVDNALWMERAGALLASLFALLALLLAVVGVYSLMAFSVRQRRQEIGIRLALGAQRGQVFWMILREGAVMAGIAGIVGVGVAFFFLGPFLTSQFHNVGQLDLSNSVAQALMLGLAALAGSFTPARRAAQLPPASSLRQA